MVIWLVGLSGAGKSTIGRATYEIIKHDLPNTVFVDGDEVRDVFKHDGDDAYTIAGRRLNSDRISALCRWLDRQGINVVCSMLSIFEEHRKANRKAFTSYFEVFIDASMEDLMDRDYKNLYKEANAGLRKNVVGIDIPFARPSEPDLIVESGNPPVNAADAAAQIVARSGVLG